MLEAVQSGFGTSLMFWAMILVPVVAYTLCIHWLEHFVQNRLASRFGWQSVLVTGWLGTPVHELSHAVMCKIFGHRIDELQLFDPDIREGRLGYVRHSFRKGNWFEEAGNVFIGTAPLLGGAMTMAALTLLFYPQIFAEFAKTLNAVRAEGTAPALGQIGLTLRSVDLFSLFHSFFSLRFVVFAYLMVCVAAHMAPSRQDYSGAMRGAQIVIGSFLLISVAIFSLTGITAAELPGKIGGVYVVSLWLAGFALTLVGAVAVLVTIITALFPKKYI